MPVADALAEVAGGPHSRFPVVDAAGEVTGLIHLRDLFVQARSAGDRLVGEVAGPAVVVGETATVPDLWRILGEQRQHVALVVNEYGDTAGLVTMEDAIEEVFGEVNDEFDTEEDPITVVNGRVSVRGDVLLSNLRDRFRVDIERAEIDTVGGLVWHDLGRLPVRGDVVEVADGIELRVDAMDGRSVVRVSFIEPGDGR